MINDLLAVIAAIVVLALLGLLFVVVPVVLKAYRRLLRRQVVVCPEDGRRALVEIDPGPPVFGAAISSFLRLRILRCSLWVGKHRCGGRCTNDERFKP
jgi:hypothetical protein